MHGRRPDPLLLKARTMRQKIKSLTIASVCAALGVVILLIGSWIEVMDLTAVFLASLLVVFAIEELGSPWQYLVWLVTSALALLLLVSPSGKFCAFEYALFGGLYPILKYHIEKLPRTIARVLKCLAFNLLFGLIMFASVKLFGLEEITLPVIGTLSKGGYFAILFILGNIVFVVYDILLTRLLLLYHRRWRKRIERFLK